MLKKSISLLGASKRGLFVVVTLIALAPAAKAGITDILSIFRTINNTLNQAGGLLNRLKNLKLSSAELEQNLVWPVNQINQAKAFVAGNETQVRSLLAPIQRLSINSATLVSPSQFQSVALSAQTANLGRLQEAFIRVYSSVPPQSQAPPLERNMMDMDDAAARGSLRTALASDQVGQQMLNVAAGIEQQAALAAPGSASLLTAQARVAELENQAYLTKMLASELRQEAVQLAHENSLRKKSVDSTRTLRINTQNILAQPGGGTQ